VSMLTPAEMQRLNAMAETGDPRAANPLAGGILGASSSPFAKSLRDKNTLSDLIAQARSSGRLTEMTQIPVAQNPRIMTQGPESLQAMMAQMRARNAQFGSGPTPQAPQPPELPPELQAISQFDDMNSRDRINAFYAQQSNPTGAPQPVQQPLEQMQPISAPQSLGGQMGGQMGAGMSGPQFPGQGGGQGGIGGLLQPIQAQMIKQFNQQKVVPLLNNFERNAQATITGGQGMQQGGGYGGGMARVGIMDNNPFGAV